MQIGTRFSVAIHILLAIELFKESHKTTSAFIASSVNTNAVVIRQIMGLLREAGLIKIAAGTGGANLLKSADAITLLDVYRAIEPVKEGKLFKMHEEPTLACPLGANISSLLIGCFDRAQEAMEHSLAQTTLAQLADRARTLFTSS